MLGRTDDEILVHVVRAYREIGEERFTVGRYQRWRQATIEREDDPIPTAAQLRMRYGSMTEALHRAVPDAPRRNLRLAAPMRVALDEAAARAAVEDAPGEAAPPARARAEGQTPSAQTPVPEANGDETTGVAMLEPLVAMARALTREELREFEQAARRRIHKLLGLNTSAWAARLRPLALLLEQEGDADAASLTVERKRYDECRPPDALTSERLVRAYGSWAAVCRAADGVMTDGRRRRVGPSARRSARGRHAAPYTRADVIAAVRLCAEELGCVPSSYRYIVWQRRKRAAVGGQGQTLRLPHYEAIGRLFHNGKNRYAWDAVKAAAFPDV